MAVCASAILLAAAAPAQAAPDPVVASILRAQTRGQITLDQARQMRATWAASARAARAAPSSSRRANIVAVRTYTTSLARSGALTGPRLEPVLLSVEATTWTMLNQTDYPGHEEEVRIPDEVVVFTYYSGRGVQVQPFETFKQGMRELNQLVPDVEAARAIADRMLELDVPRGSATSWEYYFPFGGPSRPWSSAISQAVATEFYGRIATLVPPEERYPYDLAAASATRAFLLPTTAGGTGVPSGKGRFYVMYSFAPSQRILNGHLQVLINVSRYAQTSGSAEARSVVDQGMRALLPLLPKFDTGAWSYYLPGQEAELGYHEFQTSQLVRLGEETGNSTIQEYGARFTQYLDTPPVLTLAASSWPSIIPALDGFRDKATLQFAIDKRSRVTMVVRDAVGTEVRRESWRGGRGPGVLTWNGRNAAGVVVPDGEYAVTLTSTDVVGNRTVDQLPTTLRVERDHIAPEMRLLTVRERGGRGIVTVSVSDAGSAWVHASLRIGQTVIASRRGPRAGNITLRSTRPIADVRRSELVLRDSSGNEFVYAL